MAKDVAEKTSAPEEEAAEGEAAEGAAKKKPPMMLIIIGAAVAVLVLGGGGTAAFLLLGHKPPAQAEKAEKAKAKKKPEKKEGKKDDPNAPQIADGPDGVVFYTPPDIVVNMQTADGRPTFLKLKLTFELPNADMADDLTENMPRLQDMFQTFLRELRPEDLQGSQGSYDLRMEIKRRVDLVIAPDQINNVLIEEMLIN
jgi:flagellar FliL protein